MKSLGSPLICLITKGELTTSNFKTKAPALVSLIEEAVAAGVNLVQIREKNLPARLLGDLVSGTVRTISHSMARVVVNDRVDVALACGEGGVHLGQNSMSPSLLREKFGARLLIGVSTHSLAEARSALEADANYIVFGPVFETPSKGPAVGIKTLAAVCEAVRPFPVLALGGVDDTNVEIVRQAGAAGIAAIRSMHDPESRRKICDFWRSAGTLWLS
ncbi:MAG TPA: thiamine phosphate synthase [Pyrinomonadaceae bacterium]|nr:thiamine phosphate synthase [Pyrinomonadaceae bacterium]